MRRPLVLLERQLMIYRHTWYVLLAEIFEPVLYLLSIGVGIGVLVGSVAQADGRPVRYAAFVAPALLATAAMNGAMNEVTFNMYAKLKLDHTYESMLATPVSARDIGLGEVAWATVRGLCVSVAFLIVVAVAGLADSAWILLTPLAAALVGFGFACAGLVVVTWLRSWQDFQLIQLVMLPMFLFATTFYPLSVYARPIQVLVECLPLYQSVELLRDLSLGIVGPGLLGPVVYLVAMGTGALVIALRRLTGTLSPLPARHVRRAGIGPGAAHRR
jgi:lipooligosaccharide transport system permease protein